MSTDMQELQDRIGKWAADTFMHTERGIILHLAREVAELAIAAHIDFSEIAENAALKYLKPPSKRTEVGEEAADCTILLLALANHCGFDLWEAVSTKHIVNKGRTWGKPDKHGITEHVSLEAERTPV